MENHKENFLKELEDTKDNRRFFEVFMGYLISPVITGIKPASTISFKEEFRNSYTYFKLFGEDIIKGYKLSFKILREDEASILLLIYDQENLSDHLNIEHNSNFLHGLGYSRESGLEKSLEILKGKINSSEFPHESGLFMGIPLEDVRGFLENSTCIFKGPWKVYEKEDRTKEVFNLYEKSRELYMLNKMKPTRIKDRFKNRREELYLAN